MATGHRVLKRKAVIPPPREVEPVAPRQYVDRWGTQFLVIWNGQPGDFSLVSSGCSQPTTYTAPLD